MIGLKRVYIHKITIRNYEDETLSKVSFDAGKHDTQHFHPASMKNDGQVNWGIYGFTEEQFRKFMEE